MRIGLVGPTHPYKGGVAQHTTSLATRLGSAGHDVDLVSWRRQYPRRLYPGQLEVGGAPEIAPLAATHRSLTWSAPWTWARAAWRLRRHDLVGVAHVTPVQVPAYAVLVGLLRVLRVPTVVICHNVLPHERSAVDRLLVRLLLALPDRVLVHTVAEADLARGLTRRPVSVAALAPFPPEAFARGRPGAGEHRRLLFFGLVRPYKGLDLLLEALARGPADVRLRVAGEFWGGTAATEELVRRLGLEDRVELLPGYVDADDVPALFGDVDALVLPYRSATGSQAVSTSFDIGLPVVVTRVGSLADPVRDGEDGVVVDPDVASLADGLRRLHAPGEALRLRSQVRPVDPEPAWAAYLERLTENAPRRAAQAGGPTRAGERQLEYSDLQPLMLDEQHRRTKAGKIVRVLEHVLGEGGLRGRSVVDIGCSAGFIADELAARGAVTVGLDIDRPGLRAASARFGERVRFMVGSGDAMPFADESLDLVVFNHIYEHVPDPDAVLTEIHRVLRPDGVAYLGLGNKHQLVEPHYRLPFLSWLPQRLADAYIRRTGRADRYYETYLTRAGLRRMLRGFRVLDFTLPVVHRPDAYGAGDQLGRGVPLALARLARPVIPTYIWVATKGDLEPRAGDGLAGLDLLDLRGSRR